MALCVCASGCSGVQSALDPAGEEAYHVAALGLAFSTPAMGTQFAEGVFVGEHGSWNRRPALKPILGCPKG